MDINVETITIDPTLAKFAAESGPEAFKAYLKFVTDQSKIKSDLIKQNLDVEGKKVDLEYEKIKKEEMELEAKNTFYDAIANLGSDIVNCTMFNKMNQNQIKNN